MRGATSGKIGCHGRSLLERALHRLRPRLLASLALASACAPAPSDVRFDAGLDPYEGPTVRIGRIEDAREWQNVPRSTYVQSLIGIEPEDHAMTSRVIGRRRAVPSGVLMRNVLLPEGRSVADLVEDATARGFRAAGYRIPEPGAPGHGEGPVVEGAIHRFWVRMETERPGVTYRFYGEVWLHAAVAPFADGGWVCSEALVARGGPSPGAWQDVILRGLTQLADNLASRLATRSLPGICNLPAGSSRARPHAMLAATRE